MKLLLYSNGNGGNTERLLNAIRGLAPDQETEVHQTVSSLMRRIRQRKGDVAVVILCACSREDLAGVLSIRELLHDLRTILILPDRDSNTLAQGLTLRPRFFSFLDTDFRDVAVVLARMLRIYGKESPESTPLNSDSSCGS
jgi:hypothetical protein